VVRMVFVQLYEQGLIYRAQRMMNWCPVVPDRAERPESFARERQGIWAHTLSGCGDAGARRCGNDAAGDDAGRYGRGSTPEG